MCRYDSIHCLFSVKEVEQEVEQEEEQEEEEEEEALQLEIHFVYFPLVLNV